MAKVAVRFLLVAAVLSFVSLTAPSRETAAQQAAADDLRFTVQCTRTAAPVDGGGMGRLTCTLTVSGLPDPLADVTLTVLRSDDKGDGPASNPSKGDRIPLFDGMGLTLGAPALVRRRLPAPSPPPPPASPEVPSRPPTGRGEV